MEQVTINADYRNRAGKGIARKLRREGRIPAVMYGRAGAFPLSVDGNEFTKKFRRISENTIIQLSFNGKNHDVLVKDYQQNYVKRTIMHVDFYEIEQGKLLRTNIPVVIIGTAPGVREGGIREIHLNEIEVECTPKDIPENYEVDVSNLTIGDSVHVSDLQELEGVRILSNPDQVIVAISQPRPEEEEVTEEEEEVGIEGLGEEETEEETEEEE